MLVLMGAGLVMVGAVLVQVGAVIVQVGAVMVQVGAGLVQVGARLVLVGAGLVLVLVGAGLVLVGAWVGAGGPCHSWVSVNRVCSLLAELKALTASANSASSTNCPCIMGLSQPPSSSGDFLSRAAISWLTPRCQAL